MNEIIMKFLSNSYSDVRQNYFKCLNREQSFKLWDYIFLTASNEFQAKGYRLQINKRIEKGLLPKNINFIVLPDKDNKHIGTGGATLEVIKYIAEKEKNFKNLKIAIIHSGGDSRRIPQYCSLGKIFAPIPTQLNCGHASTIFDENIMLLLAIGSRINEGLVCLCGDSVLLCNPLQISFSNYDAGIVTIKKDKNIGVNHGVVVRGEKGRIDKYIHKQNTQVLEKFGAIDSNGKVEIDSGLCLFSPKVIEAFYNLICDNEGKISMEKYNLFVNEKTQLSLYGDFLYVLAKNSSLDEYLTQPASVPLNEELKQCRNIIFEKLHKFEVYDFVFHPAIFLQFKTSKEIFQLMTEDITKFHDIGWKKNILSLINDNVSGINSVLSPSAKIGEKCYLENSYIHKNAKIGNNCILSYVEIKNQTIPDNVIIHAQKLLNGKYVVLIFGIGDNPKDSINDCTLFGKNVLNFLKQNNIEINKIFNEGNEQNLWNAKIFSVCESLEQAVNESLNLYNLINEKGGDLNAFINNEKISFSISFYESNCEEIITWENKMNDIQSMEKILLSIKNNQTVEELKQELKILKLTENHKEWLEMFKQKASFYDLVHMYYFLSEIVQDSESKDNLWQKSFIAIKDFMYNAYMQNHFKEENLTIKTDKFTVELPLRINFAGGWTDTPPQCVDNGGIVLNASILLNGNKPVKVTLEKIKELKIILKSNDLNEYKEFEDISELQDISNPYDNLVLQKSALLTCGVIPFKGGNLQEILKSYGGGIVFIADIYNVPKGSGLGTSSILGAACVKALFGFFGIEYNNEKLFDNVLIMEQIMTTGGGWQDQIGGAIDGLKLITTEPGIIQNYKIEKINLNEEIVKKLNERFVIIYSGQRRLARNLLRDVIGKYLGNNPNSLRALKEMKKLAIKMKDALIKGDIDEFAMLMSEHYKYSIMLDQESTNTLIDFIFSTIDDLIVGKMLVGAGGGGFLDVILKEGVSKEQLEQRLREYFSDFDVKTWDSSLLI